MRTVNLIQFTEEHIPVYGYAPTVNQIYQVNELEDSYIYETEDDDGEYYEESIPSVSIFTNKRERHITDLESANFNLLTIVLDDDSQLFRR